MRYHPPGGELLGSQPTPRKFDTGETSRTMARKVDLSKLNFDEDSIVEDIDLDTEVIFVDGERLTEQRAQEITAEVLAKAAALSHRARDAK